SSHLGAHPCPRHQQHYERAGGSPRLRLRTLVRTPARGISNIMSGRAEAPGCDFAPWCAPLPAASAVRCQDPLPAGCRPAAHVWRKPPVAFCTVVRTPARGVSSALPGHFTRGLPPCGSCVAEAPGCVLHLGAHPCPRRQLRVARTLYPRAAALRLIRAPPCGSGSCHHKRPFTCESQTPCGTPDRTTQWPGDLR
ncbi:MAG: hypothetical protein RLZZ436_4707, partial [Planctomycetota bacterium]